MLKYYIFGFPCIINSCLCISFPACEYVDIHCVCARRLQEWKKKHVKNTFSDQVTILAEKQSTAFNTQQLLLHDLSPSM